MRRSRHTRSTVTVVAVLAAGACLGVVLFSTRQRAPGVTELELNLPKPVGSDLVSQFGQYVDTLNAARSAVTSVGNGITTGIFAARAPKGALQPGRPATSEGTSVVMATEGNKFEEVKARAQEDPAASPATAVGTPVVKAAENKLGEAVNGPETKPAAVKHMDEAIHTTAVKSMQPERENGAVKLAHRMLRTGLTSRNAQPAAERVPRWTGKTAIKDIDSYFDTVPTRNVNSFHEAAKKALHFGSAFGSEQSRDDLDGYFTITEATDCRLTHRDIKFACYIICQFEMGIAGKYHQGRISHGVTTLLK